MVTCSSSFVRCDVMSSSIRATSSLSRGRIGRLIPWELLDILAGGTQRKERSAGNMVRGAKIQPSRAPGYKKWCTHLISSSWRAKTGDPALFFLSRRRPQPMNLSHACQKRVRVRHELRFVALQQQARLDDHADCAQPHHTLEAKMEAGLLVPVGRVFRGVWRYDFKFCKFSACCSSSSGQQYDLAAQCST